MHRSRLSVLVILAAQAGAAIENAVLAEAGIRYFFTDTHGVLHAEPRPKFMNWKASTFRSTARRCSKILHLNTISLPSLWARLCREPVLLII